MGTVFYNGVRPGSGFFELRNSANDSGCFTLVEGGRTKEYCRYYYNQAAGPMCIVAYVLWLKERILDGTFNQVETELTDERLQLALRLINGGFEQICQTGSIQAYLDDTVSCRQGYNQENLPEYVISQARQDVAHIPMHEL